MDFIFDKSVKNQLKDWENVSKAGILCRLVIRLASFFQRRRIGTGETVATRNQKQNTKEKECCRQYTGAIQLLSRLFVVENFSEKKY